MRKKGNSMCKRYTFPRIMASRSATHQKDNDTGTFNRQRAIMTAMLAILLGLSPSLPGKATAATNGLIQDVRIVCNRWPDGTDMQQFASDSIRLMGAETNEEKALAIWRFIRMWTAYTDGHTPTERALGDTYVDDPVKVLNVYGAHWCDGLARVMEVAWRSLDYRAEKLYRSGHTLADLYWQDTDGLSRWHLFDVSEGWFIYDITGSHVASPDEIASDYSLIFRPTKGPVPRTPHYWGMWNWIHAPHIKWPTYKPGLELRSGQTRTLLFHNLSQPYEDNFKKKGETDFEHGPYPVTYGNGIVKYTPDLSQNSYINGLYTPPINTACREEDGLSPNLHVKTPGTPAKVIFAVTSPYIIADASISGSFFRKTANDRLAISISTDSGNTWKTIWEAGMTGNVELDDMNIAEKFDIYQGVPNGLVSPFGKYQFLLKIEMESDGAISDVGINSLEITTITQHNIFSLPQLWPGTNAITVRGNVAADMSLKVTYTWKDLMGAERKNVTIVENTPYNYEIVTSGNRWEDVRVDSITIEALPRTSDGNRTVVKEQIPNTINSVTPQDAFATEQIVGTAFPPPLKTVDEYISDLQTLQTQVEALSGLMRLKDPASIPAIKEVAFNSIAFPNKDLAVQALFRINPVQATPILLDILKKDPTVKWKQDPNNIYVELGHWYNISALIGRLMARQQLTAAVPDLMAVLDNIIANNDGWWEPHASIIRSLGMLGAAPQAAASIRPFLTRQPDVVAIAVWALGELGDTDSIPAIRNLFNTSSYEMITLFAAEALGKLGDQLSAPKMYQMLESEDEDFRGYAAAALGTLGNQEAVPRLENLLQTETFPWVRDVVQNSIAMLTQPVVLSPPTNLHIVGN